MVTLIRSNFGLCGLFIEIKKSGRVNLTQLVELNKTK
jgi:hypothetical protein